MTNIESSCVKALRGTFNSFKYDVGIRRATKTKSSNWQNIIKILLLITILNLFTATAAPTTIIPTPTAIPTSEMTSFYTSPTSMMSTKISTVVTPTTGTVTVTKTTTTTPFQPTTGICEVWMGHITCKKLYFTDIISIETLDSFIRLFFWEFQLCRLRLDSPRLCALKYGKNLIVDVAILMIPFYIMVLSLLYISLVHWFKDTLQCCELECTSTDSIS